MGFHIFIFLKPSISYLNPGTGSILIQLLSAALGGGLFFLIKGQWKKWFKKKGKDESGAVEKEEGKPEAIKEFAVLPKKCPNCKQKLDPKTVTWIDGETAKCPHCGEVVESIKP